jgi:hypothetical protein
MCFCFLVVLEACNEIASLGIWVRLEAVSPINA